MINSTPFSRKGLEYCSECYAINNTAYGSTLQHSRIDYKQSKSKISAFPESESSKSTGFSSFPFLIIELGHYKCKMKGVLFVIEVKLLRVPL